MALLDYALAIIKQGKEMEFQQEAHSAGALCYVPLMGRTTKPKHKRKPVVSYRPLFPGYAFAGINKRFVALRGIDGFKRFLSVDGEVIPIKGREIKELRERERSGEFLDRPVGLQTFSFKIGDHVRVSDGAFVGYCGTVINIVNDKHTLDVTGCSYNWTVTVTGNHLERVL